jgi:hypothetical protein
MMSEGFIFVPLYGTCFVLLLRQTELGDGREMVNSYHHPYRIKEFVNGYCLLLEQTLEH